MSKYYVSKESHEVGLHEVHNAGCPILPDASELIELNSYISCVPAVKEAKLRFPNSEGCPMCAPYCSSREVL